MLKKRISALCVMFVAALAMSGVSAKADLYNLTGPPDGYEKVQIGDAWFYNVNASSTGSGVIQSFVRIQTNKAVEQGYNTDGTLEFDENNSSQFTHSLLLSDVPIVNISGTDYREFLLDINQNKTGPGRLLSLDKLELYQAAVGNLSGYPALGTQVYSLDSADMDNTILLDYSLNHGSGSGDMFAYIPEDLFGEGDYVYLYSMFGAYNDNLYPNTASYEEWAVREGATPPTPPPVPVPGAVLLGVLGLGMAGVKLRRLA